MATSASTGQCTMCGRENPRTAVICPNCGSHLPWASPKPVAAKRTRKATRPASPVPARQKSPREQATARLLSLIGGGLGLLASPLLIRLVFVMAARRSDELEIQGTPLLIMVVPGGPLLGTLLGALLFPPAIRFIVHIARRFAASDDKE